MSSTPWRSQRALQARRGASAATATHHPLLGLRSQISHGARPGYLSGTPVELDVGADALGHLADRRRQPAGAAVGDRRVQARRRSASTSISSFSVIGSPICTLAPATSPVVASIVSAGERGAADAVATGAPAEHDDAVAGVRAGRRRPVVRRRRCSRRTRAGWWCSRGRRAPRRRRSAGRSCCRSRRRRRRRPSRMRRGWSAPSGSVVGRQVGRAEAQHVGDGDRPVGGAQHVADHAADAGVGAAERLDRRRVVVRLGLDARASCPATNDTMPALPTNAERTNGAAIGVGGVAQLPHQGRDRSRPSSVVIRARNVLCAQCSLHVWASVSSSTSVGSRPGRGSGPGSLPAPAGSSASARAAFERGEPGGVEVADRHDSAAAPVTRRRRRTGARSVDGDQRSITGLASTRRSERVDVASAGSPGGSSMRRRAGGRAHADAELAGGAHERAGRGVGDAGVQGDLVGVVVGRRVVPRRRSAAAGRRGTARAGRGRRRRGRRRRRTTSLTTDRPGQVDPVGGGRRWRWRRRGGRCRRVWSGGRGQALARP